MQTNIQTKLSQVSRSRLLLGLMLIIVALFLMRLFYIQIIQHGYYSALAVQSQMTKETIVAERGEIYVKDGDDIVPLVLNETVFTLFADPQNIENRDELLEKVKDISGGQMVDESVEMLDDQQLRYVVLARGLSLSQAELIKEADIAGLGLQSSTRRVYPEGAMAAQTLGYVDSEGNGQYGVESALQSRLAGENGVLEAVTDVRRIPLTIGSDDVRIPAKNGDDVVLTLDRNIQSYAEEALARGLKNANATKGSVIVMDPRDGSVLAMASLPTYQPAKFNEVEDYAVFQNPIVSSPYEAGSVIKNLTVGAGIDSGAVSARSTFDNLNIVDVDGTAITNVEEDPVIYGATLTDTLHYSLNTGVVYVLQQMGGGEVNKQARQELYKYFHDRYRFGQLTGIEQANEQQGIILGPDEADGPNVRYANMAFGQGMDVTMIQAASAFSASINGGTFYKPHLTAGVKQNDGTIVAAEPEILANNVLSKASSKELHEMTYQARNLGFFGDVDPEGYKVGGKTGTSQIIDPKTGRYSDDNSIGSYLGFGGAEEPEYVIMVRVDDANIGGYEGTTAAGPIFNDISNWMINYLRIEPIR